MLALDHEARDDAVERTPFISKGLPILAHPMLAGTQLPEILSCRRHGILIQLKDYSAPLVLPKWSNVKVHSGSVRPGRFLQVSTAAPAVMRAHKSKVIKFTALDLGSLLIGGLNNAGVYCASTLLGTAIGSGCPVCCACPGGPSLRDVALLALPESPIPSVRATALRGMRKGPSLGRMYLLDGKLQSSM